MTIQCDGCDNCDRTGDWATYYIGGEKVHLCFECMSEQSAYEDENPEYDD